ncbi:MAG: type 3 dihydrofolate reductase [Clostridia bacterium]|nr:type 3 dihydrofolate reductase [Clostridia bacterium]
MISLIAAVARDNIIGKGNSLPWRLPADLAYFKKVTMGHKVIMGRKTFESIGKPLPGRSNVIISRDRDYKAEGCTIVNSIDEAERLCVDEEAFIIGGAQVYEMFIDRADRLYITFIDEAFDGDAYFPNIDPSVWRQVSKTKGEKDEKNPFDYYFIIYERH